MDGFVLLLYSIWEGFHPSNPAAKLKPKTELHLPDLLISPQPKAHKKVTFQTMGIILSLLA